MRTKLSNQEIEEALKGLTCWETDGLHLKKSVKFETYKDGLVFAVAVGQLADRMNHHPDLAIGYQRVDISLSTHDAGGITESDVRLASQIEGIL